MRTGRKPTPKKILEMRDSTYLAKNKNRQELIVNAELPVAPSWVSKKGKDYWEQIVSELYEIGIIGVVDTLALSLLVDALAQYIEARTEYEETGITETTNNGNRIQAPVVGAMNKAWDKVYKIIRDFGMTPSSRVGMDAINSIKDNGTKKINDISDIIDAG